MPNLTADQHAEASRRAHAAADRLMTGQDPWFVVPRFYAALHHIMRDLKQRTDLPDEEMRNPETHGSRWDNGRRTAWGMTDVVTACYDRSVSQAYSQLLSASHTARYAGPVPWGDAQRFERHWERLRHELPAG